MPTPPRMVFDGHDFHHHPCGLSTYEWLREVSTLRLQRFLSGAVRLVSIDPRDFRRLVRAELARREPDHERANATAAAVGARRRWLYVLPVFSNYSNGGSH